MLSAQCSTPARVSRLTSLVVLAAACLATLGATSAPAATQQRATGAADLACSSAPGNRSRPAIPQSDVWRSSSAYSFPFNGYTPTGKGKILWKKIKYNALRRTHYPAPNLPSCRIGVRGAEDRTSRKVARYVERLNPINGERAYILRDSFDRPVAVLRWEPKSLIKRYPERFGWHVDGKWAGHHARRAFEIQGEACKLRIQTDIVMVGTPPAPVPVRRWVRDRAYAMIAFNPALGSPGGKTRPRKTSDLRIRAFVDKRAIPWGMGKAVSSTDFGCGTAPIPPMLTGQPLGNPVFKSGYGPGRAHMIGQYFGESASPAELLPGENKIHNNMPYNAYNAKPQFYNAVYAMHNTTGIAGGGMVRGIARAETDEFILHDEMSYCDPNYTLRHMLLKRNGRRVSKWSYFELANFSAGNTPTVRWVYGELRPALSTLSGEGIEASANPASQKFYAWMPVNCDR
ncbi:MAG: hypothetical protein WAP35_02325 [Solirubrobacterales bacterium]